MKSLINVIVALLVITNVVISAGLGDEKPNKKTAKEKKDIASLQGVWVCEKFSVDGNTIDATPGKGVPEGQAMRVRFKGDKYILTQSQEPNGPFKTYKIDPSKKPKTIDLEARTGTSRGIYAIDGDQLKLKFYKDMTKQPNGYPKDFSTKQGDGFTTLECRKNKN